jgi:3-phenylpropionate/trans-cinnamate dioxygenase ferredoxin reductase subunit
VVVVGGGVAAHGAVTGLRRAGFDGEVIVVGREPHPPYERPFLSKSYLLHEVTRQRLFLPPLPAHVRLGEKVIEIEPDRRAVRLASGERLEYSRLLLATGARPRLLPGHEHRLALRELGHADRLLATLDAGGPLEVVGAGFIGCEVAAVARRRGMPVTVYEALDQPLLRVLGPDLGAWLGEVHRARGVDLRTGVRELPPLGEATLISVGSQPNVELAQAAGIRCDNGIVVDERGSTDAPGVWAAGDCARFWSPLFDAPVRVEHYQTAHRHGLATGRAIASEGQPFAEAPWFWSDQYDLNLQYVGAGLPWDETVLRGRIGEPPFTVFFLGQGRLLGALGVGAGRLIGHVRRLLEGRVEVTAEQLADPGVDLKPLTRPAPL